MGHFSYWKSYKTRRKPYILRVDHFDPQISREILDLCLPCEVPVRGWGGLSLERREIWDKNLWELWECRERESPTSCGLEQLFHFIYVHRHFFLHQHVNLGEHGWPGRMSKSRARLSAADALLGRWKGGGCGGATNDDEARPGKPVGAKLSSFKDPRP